MIGLLFPLPSFSFPRTVGMNARRAPKFFDLQTREKSRAAMEKPFFVNRTVYSSLTGWLARSSVTGSVTGDDAHPRIIVDGFLPRTCLQAEFRAPKLQAPSLFCSDQIENIRSREQVRRNGAQPLRRKPRGNTDTDFHN
jgi:hypothetical protein